MLPSARAGPRCPASIRSYGTRAYTSCCSGRYNPLPSAWSSWEPAEGHGAYRTQVDCLKLLSRVRKKWLGSFPDCSSNSRVFGRVNHENYQRRPSLCEPRRPPLSPVQREGQQPMIRLASLLAARSPCSPRPRRPTPSARGCCGGQRTPEIPVQTTRGSPRVPTRMRKPSHAANGYRVRRESH